MGGSFPNHAVGSLLGVLRPIIETLPKDPRTIMKTQQKYEISQTCGGEYYYFGILNGIHKIIRKYTEIIQENFKLFALQINIDGLSLFKSTNQQFWPILGSLINDTDKDPFIMVIFSGRKKPDNLNAYLHKFIEE